MVQATWRGAVLATSDRTIPLEGNQYFPPQDVDFRFLRPSKTHTRCPWKGTASYYDVVVDDEVNRDAAWTYPTPTEAAGPIKDRIAFWHGVAVG